MAPSRSGDLRDLTVEELESRVDESKQELFNLRFQHVTGQLDNSARLGQLRKDLARMHTILRQHEIAAAEAAEEARAQEARDG